MRAWLTRAFGPRAVDVLGTHIASCLASRGWVSALDHTTRWIGADVPWGLAQITPTRNQRRVAVDSEGRSWPWRDPFLVAPRVSQSLDMDKYAVRPEAGQGSVILIRPRHGWAALDLRELWSYRELFYFFVWRDLKVRYRQTAFGAAWAVAQPFLLMVVLPCSLVG